MRIALAVSSPAEKFRGGATKAKDALAAACGLENFVSFSGRATLAC
jgi:hypothetical protein